MFRKHPQCVENFLEMCVLVPGASGAAGAHGAAHSQGAAAASAELCRESAPQQQSRKDRDRDVGWKGTHHRGLSGSTWLHSVMSPSAFWGH